MEFKLFKVNLTDFYLSKEIFLYFNGPTVLS